MGTIKDLKQKLFGPFLNWLEANNLDDPFSNDVWASKIFDKLKENADKEFEFGGMLNAMPDTVFDKYSEIRKKQKESKKNIATPDKDLVKPDGSKL
jgi:hypothetical protein